jgi:GT2 family glycosyltransferase
VIDLSIVIVAYNVKEYLAACLASVYEHPQDLTHEVIVVDNASSDGTCAAVAAKFPHVRLITNARNLGFAAASNQGFAESKGEYVLLLNPDTELRTGCAEAVVGFMRRTPDAAVAGCRLVDGDGTIQKSVHRFPSAAGNLAEAVFLDRLLFAEKRRAYYRAGDPRRVDYCSGAFMLIRRAALEGMAPLSEDYHMYSEEKDLALRLKRKGWNVYFVPLAVVVHHGGRSADQMRVRMFVELQRSQVRFYRNHYRPLYRLVLAATWAGVLLSNTLISVPLALAAGRFNRLLPFATALCAYPVFVATELYRKRP